MLVCMGVNPITSHTPHITSTLQLCWRVEVMCMWCVRCDRLKVVYGMLEVAIFSDVYSSLACRIPTHLALLRSEPHFQEPLAHAVFITTGTTSCTAKSSFVMLFLIEFIACFCCCGGYALSHILKLFFDMTMLLTF